MKNQPAMKNFPGITVAGKRLKMSYLTNKTRELWQDFMPQRKGFHALSTDLYSVEVNPEGYFGAFDPGRNFEKWAGAPVSPEEPLPAGLELLNIPPGDYAVFIYRGKASDAPGIYRYIFTEWLPASSFRLDDRPHFAVMGKGYKGEDPESEEEIWIPVKSIINC